MNHAVVWLWNIALILFPNKEVQGWLGTFDFCLKKQLQGYRLHFNACSFLQVCLIFQFTWMQKSSRKELEDIWETNTWENWCIETEVQTESWVETWKRHFPFHVYTSQSQQASLVF